MSTLITNQVRADQVRTNEVQTSTGKPILNSAGSIIQTVYVRSDAFTTFSASPSGDGTTISALGITISPTSPNSRIICNWVICGEVGAASDCVWLIHRDGALITTVGAEGRNSLSNARWVGFAPTPYDVDFNSTPFSLSIQYSQIVGSTGAKTYAPAIRSSSASAQTFYLNRTITSAGQDSYENMVSTGVAYEVVG
jgi:hypothetical protein